MHSYALVREMLETPALLGCFELPQDRRLQEALRRCKRILLTGEGSSRIFPAKNAIALAHRIGLPHAVITEGCRQAGSYNLDEYLVLGASNSGRTRELIWLFEKLKAAGHSNLFGLTATPDSLLAKVADSTFVLGCGPEEAVAATKSVMEEALFYVALLLDLKGRRLQREQLAGALEAVLAMPLDAGVVEMLARSETVYFAGPNDGVAEELTLKANEIIRKRSDYLEGTYLLHGIEEVMSSRDTLVLIDPYADDLRQIRETLEEGVGIQIIAISHQGTDFPTIRVPNLGELSSFIYLAAGWKLLLSAGLQLGIDLDHPRRARKVGYQA